MNFIRNVHHKLEYSLGLLKFQVTTFQDIVFRTFAFIIVKYYNIVEWKIVKFGRLGRYSMYTEYFRQISSVWGHSVHFRFSTILYLKMACRAKGPKFRLRMQVFSVYKVLLTGNVFTEMTWDIGWTLMHLPTHLLILTMCRMNILPGGSVYDLEVPMPKHEIFRQYITYQGNIT